MKKIITFIGSLGMPLTTFAHAGDHSATQVSHFASSPFHVLPTIVIIAVLSYFVIKKIYSTND